MGQERAVLACGARDISLFTVFDITDTEKALEIIRKTKIVSKKSQDLQE